MEHVLQAQHRTELGRRMSRRLRRRGLIPAVCYGGRTEPLNVSIDPESLRRLLVKAPNGRNTVIELKTGDASHQVMLQEIQRDPVRRAPVHVDFRRVSDDDRVVVSIPVRTTGRSPAEETGAQVVAVRRVVDVRTLVKDIPESILIDVNTLVLGDKIRASELTAPQGGEISYKSDYVVLAVVSPRGEEEETEALEEGEEGAVVEEEA